jgi:antitoxin YefM
MVHAQGHAPYVAGACYLDEMKGQSLELVQVCCYHPNMTNAALDVVTYSHARQNLKEVMDRAADDHMPVVISRRDGKPVVMVSLEDWNGMQETAYLLGNDANRKALLESIAELDSGNGINVEFAADGSFTVLNPITAA